MRKQLLSFIAVLLPFLLQAEINIWASALYLTINGNSGFYNTHQQAPPYAIGNISFENDLGIFGKNSGNLTITGAEVNLLSTGSSNSSAKIFYSIYRTGQRPASIIFNEFVLQPYCKCNGSSFNGCGGRACDDINDQKLQNVNQAIDLTNVETGRYTIEVYFLAYGDDGAQDIDNNGAGNYKASFTITAPLAVNIISLHAYAAEEDIRIRWAVQNDADVITYEIEKSMNGLNFSRLDTIGSLQNPTGSNYYFSDKVPVIGTNYYRIKSYSTNGTVSLSNVFRIYYGKVGNTVLIYPNPVDGELTMRFAGINKGSYKMSVLGTNGQVVLTQQLYHDGTDKTIRVALPPGMQRGIYRLFLINKQLFYKQAFMVK